jgi:hypothetical protein
LQKAYRDALDDTGASYLGARPPALWREISARTLHSWIDERFATQGVETAEIALDLVAFRRLVRAALDASDKVTTLYNHKVESVVRTSAGFRVRGVQADGEPWTREAEIVVNCLWDGRLELDQQVGLLPRHKWVYRLKYRLLGELSRSLSGLPSFTMVLGPYGDIVVHPSAPAYLSWYPACMQGWSTALAPPPSWDSACNGQVDRKLMRPIVQEALAAFERIVPGILGSRIETVDAGIICSWGESDISDPASELHQRFDVGLHAHDGYYSIDTGKLTCAPLFARQLLDAIR